MSTMDTPTMAIFKETINVEAGNLPHNLVRRKYNGMVYLKGPIITRTNNFYKIPKMNWKWWKNVVFRTNVLKHIFPLFAWRSKTDNSKQWNSYEFLSLIKIWDAIQVTIVHPERQTRGMQLKQRRRSLSSVVSFKTKEHLGKKVRPFCYDVLWNVLSSSAHGQDPQ